MQLTDKGVELRDQLRDKYQILIDRINHKLSEQEINNLIQVIHKIKKETASLEAIKASN